MRVGPSESSSVSMGNEYTDEFENQDTSDDAEFWCKESVPRFAAGLSVSRSGWHTCALVSVTAVILLILIITVSVSHVKFESKFSASETNMKNLTQTLLSIITRTKHLEEYGHKVHLDISNLEFDHQTMQAGINEVSDAAQTLHNKVSELKCQIIKISNKNNTETLCCPDGWSLFSSHCYFSLIMECRGMQPKMNEFVISKTRPLFYWLGLTDGRTGKWEWLDQTPYTIVRSEWMPGQPDNWQAHGLGVVRTAPIFTMTVAITMTTALKDIATSAKNKQTPSNSS